MNTDVVNNGNDDNATDEEDEYEYVDQPRPERRVRFENEVQELGRSTRSTRGKRPAYLRDYVM